LALFCTVEQPFVKRVYGPSCAAQPEAPGSTGCGEFGSRGEPG
jgi:hypothetical protein